jgi:hypothetical protein
MARNYFKHLLLQSFFIFFTLQFYAQDFEVSPAKIIFEAEPGQTQSIPISILNHSNTKQAYILELSDFIINKEGVHIIAPSASTEHSLANWISINPPFLELNPNEARQVIISIQAPSGDYTTKWANISVKATSEQTAFSVDKVKQAALSVSPQIIIQVSQSPKSNINYKMKLGNFIELTQSKDTIRRFQLTADNLGDKITNCRLVLLAADLSTAKETIITETKFSSYPDSQLLIKLQMNKVLPPGRYALAAILDYGSKINLEGAQILIEVK